MEKEYFEFDDKKLEALRLELLDKEMFARLRTMNLEELDDILEECCKKEENLTSKLELFGQLITQLEQQFDAIEEFVKKYLTVVYLEEHGIDIREDGNDNIIEEDGDV